MENVTIYTDGSCLGNPGPGGWAYLVQKGSCETVGKGNEPKTTNNRMELLAVVKALEETKEHKKKKIYVDSKYVKDGATSYMKNWKKNGWITSAKTPVKNKDLWLRLDALISEEITWGWVKGHSGHRENGIVDATANQEAHIARSLAIRPAEKTINGKLSKK